MARLKKVSGRTASSWEPQRRRRHRLPATSARAWLTVTIESSVLATAVGIDAAGKPEVGTIVVRDDRGTGIAIELRLRRWIIRLVPVRVPLVRRVLKPVRRILRRPAPV